MVDSNRGQGAETDASDNRVVAFVRHLDVNLVVGLLQVEVVGQGRRYCIRINLFFHERSHEAVRELKPDALKVLTWSTFHDELGKFKRLALRESLHVSLARPCEVDFAGVELLA